MSEAMPIPLAEPPRFEPWARPSRIVAVLRMFRANPLGAVGASIILLMAVIAILAPVIARYDINAYAGLPGGGPSAQNWFGTDKFGQDIYSRVVYGTRVSFQVGVLSVLIGVATGLIVGSTSGYFGGWIDTVIQRFVDAAIAFPQLILLLIIVRTLGPSMRNVIIVIAIGIIPSTTRIIRGAALTEKNQLYVEAARSVGASDVRIVFRHVIPNVVPVAIVVSTTLLGTAILAESALSFLGLGIPPPNPSWGVDISTARTSYPVNLSAALFPGFAISLTVLGFNFFGDTLRDVLDPRLRGAR
jgi:ABC-type dipeptide/oligopeptide/nickel transport system permease subunit